MSMIVNDLGTILHCANLMQHTVHDRMLQCVRTFHAWQTMSWVQVHAGAALWT